MLNNNEMLNSNIVYAARPAVSLAILLFAVCASNSIGAADHVKRVPWRSGFVGSPEPPLPLVLERAFPKLSFMGPISINRMPSSDRMVVLEQNNKIWSFVAREDVAQAELLIDFAKQRPLCGRLEGRDQGNIALYSIAFHPRFAENRFAYVCYVSDAKDAQKTHISRFTIDRHESPQLLVDSEVELITCDGGGHNGCTLLFDKFGYLYISIGDLTEPSPPDRLNTGQDISDLYASILRIDVDHADAGRNYSIPSDNPFVKLKSARPEVFAYGLRNPFRMSIDPVTEDIWVGDVGWEAWEMVYRIRSAGNYGWAIKEGPGDVKPQKPGPTPISPPEIALGHNEAASVTGGFVYRGKKHAEINGKYIFGDWITRKFWAASFDALRVTKLEEIAVGQVKPICFEVDADGELLILEYSEGNQAGGIYRFALNPAAKASTERFPRALSASGLFADTAMHTLAPGVAGYRINAPMWVDGAKPEYMLAIPGEEAAVFYQNPHKTFNWFNTTVTLPLGTVLAKTLSLPIDYRKPESTRRVETQVAFKDSQGQWQYYSYRWNDAGTDAELVPARGAQQAIAIQEVTGLRNLNWQFASRSQCRTCHTPWTGETNGFIEAQLRNPRAQTDAWRQLAAGGWSKLNEKPEPLGDEFYSALVDPHDDSQPLDRRARSYLHTNCAHCHMNGGNASTVFETLFNKPLSQTKMLVSKPMRGDFGLKESQIVMPGEPTQSVLFFRMAKSGTGRMPHIGSQLSDAAGVRLIGQWIASLPKNKEHLAALDELCGPTVRRDDEQRLKAARELLGSLDGCIELSSALAEQRVPAGLVHSIVSEAMKLDDAARRELIEPYAAADQQVLRLGPNLDVPQLLTVEGDAAKGEKLFATGVGQCSQCHRIGNVGKEVGPDLSRVADKLKTREKILNSIIDPSAEIEDKYRAVTILTSDGQTRVGRVLSRDGQQVTLQDAEGKLTEVATEDIELEKPVTNSLMPQQLLAPLTAEQAANLLAYLSTLR